MKLILEVGPEEYDRIVADDRPVVLQHVEGAEVRSGVLAEDRRVLYAEMLGSVHAGTLGVDTPAIRLSLGPREEGE